MQVEVAEVGGELASENSYTLPRFALHEQSACTGAVAAESTDAPAWSEWRCLANASQTHVVAVLSVTMAGQSHSYVAAKDTEGVWQACGTALPHARAIRTAVSISNSAKCPVVKGAAVCYQSSPRWFVQSPEGNAAVRASFTGSLRRRRRAACALDLAACHVPRREALSAVAHQRAVCNPL